MASMSGVSAGRGRERPERRSLEEVRDSRSETALTAAFSRRRMKKAIIRITTRKATAPPIIPPISAVVRPLLLLGVPEAGVLAIAVGVACTFGIKPPSVLAVAVGAAGVVTA